MNKLSLVATLALLLASALCARVEAQTTANLAIKVCSSASGVQLCNYVPVNSGNPLPVNVSGAGQPGTSTGPDQFISVTSGSVTTVSLPADTTAVNIWPVCTTAGTGGVAVYFESDGGTPTNAQGNPVASLQLIFDWNLGIATNGLKLIAASGASGCIVTLNTYK